MTEALVVIADVKAGWDGDLPKGMRDAKDMRDWTVTLHHDGRSMVTPFFTGLALATPTANDVLQCLVSDALGVTDGQTFEEWAGEYGYDEDSRSAERTYRDIVKQTEQLRALLGDRFDDALEQFQDR